jgi:hypothetical protein
MAARSDVIAPYGDQAWSNPSLIVLRRLDDYHANGRTKATRHHHGPLPRRLSSRSRAFQTLPAAMSTCAIKFGARNINSRCRIQPAIGHSSFRIDSNGPANKRHDPQNLRAVEGRTPDHARAAGVAILRQFGNVAASVAMDGRSDRATQRAVAAHGSRPIKDGLGPIKLCKRFFDPPPLRSGRSGVTRISPHLRHLKMRFARCPSPGTWGITSITFPHLGQVGGPICSDARRRGGSGMATPHNLRR